MTGLPTPFQRLAAASLRAKGWRVFPPAHAPEPETYFVPHRGASEARFVLDLFLETIYYETCTRKAKCTLPSWNRWITRSQAKREPKL